jgi:hypothetical protein
MFTLSLIVENGNDRDIVQACTDFGAIMQDYSQLLATPRCSEKPSKIKDLGLSNTTISARSRQ